jgi:hypothetical protein
VKVTVEGVLTDDVIAVFYPVYVAAFDALRSRAAARHVLTAEEFAGEMVDRRIEKYVVWDDDGGPLALTTLATDLAAIPWISADYYAARFPDAATKGVLFYLGYTLVDRSRRRPGALMLMVQQLERRLVESRGVIAFDICGYNDARGVGRRVAELFRPADRVETLDTQTYYAADFRGLPQPVEAPTVAGATPTQREAGPAHNVTLADRPDLAIGIPAVLESRWPAFMLAGHAGHGVDLTRLIMETPEHQTLLVGGDDELLGVGISVPLEWNGTVDGLPDGWDGAVSAAAELLDRGGRPNAVCALSITLASTATGRGMAAGMVDSLKEAARSIGAEALIIPIRPSLKARYPLTPMRRYLDWRTADGEVFDSWLRLHLRLGAVLLGVSDPAMTITGSIAEWQEWLAQPLPESGDYVIQGGLVPLVVDRDADLAVYREPNVWVSYRL